MATFIVVCIYLLIGAFWGRIYYNRETGAGRLHHDDREEVLGCGVAFIWPLWVTFHILRLSMLTMFKLADYACGKGHVSHGLGGGR